MSKTSDYHELWITLFMFVMTDPTQIYYIPPTKDMFDESPSASIFHSEKEKQKTISGESLCN